MVLSVVPFMAGLGGIFSLLGIGQPWFGFLFLVYWAAILRQEPSDYLPSIAGAAGGLALGWLLTVGPASGLAGQAGAAAVLAAVLFCFMRGLLRWICNNAMMLYLVAATIPALDVVHHLGTMLAALLVAAGYMGIIAWLFRWFMTRRSARA
jgi:hypothetical protein